MSYQDQDQASLGAVGWTSASRPNRCGTRSSRTAGLPRFLAAARAAELENNLQGPDLISVFAVPDEALQSENEDVLRNVVGQHVVHGLQTAADIRTASTLRSLAGPPVTVAWEDGRPRFGNARVVQADIACTNGMIHVLDKLMLECSYAS